MKNKIRFVMLLLFVLTGGLVYAQGDSRLSDEQENQLVQRLSDDADFKDFFLQNMQYLEQRERGNMSDEDIAAFHEKQRERFENVKSRFPELWELPEKTFTRIRNRAWDLVNKDM